MTAPRCCIVAALCLYVCCLPAFAEIVTEVVADADTFIWVQGYGGGDMGNQGAVVTVQVGGPDNFRKLYLHFDLSSLASPGLPVTSAYLRLKNTGSGYAGAPNSGVIFAILDEEKDWDLSAIPETGAGSMTWYNAPQNDTTGTGNPGGNGIFPISYPNFLEEGTDATAVTRQLGVHSYGTTGGELVDIDLDVTDLVQWLLGQNGPYSTFVDTDEQVTICVRNSNVSGYNYPFYASKEYTSTDPSDAPRLVITQVPEPMVLGLLGLGALAVIRRRQ